MRVAIIVNVTRAQAQECTSEVIDILKKSGCETYLKQDLFDESGFEYEKIDPVLNECDMFIAVGGDGTIIHTAKIAALADKPILGINAGKLGFTAGLERSELSLLSKLTEKDYLLEERVLLSVNLISDNGKSTQSLLAMNDAVVTGERAKIIDYTIAFGEHVSYTYRADGFIVATPTGSTAYSLSAGGPIIDPKMECLEYTPICPHSLFDRSIIFSSGMKLYVSMLDNCRDMQLTVDGEMPIPVRPEDKLVFTGANRTAKFIRLNNRNFYDTLNKKIIDGK